MSAGWLRTASENGQKDDAGGGEPLAERGRHRDAVEYRIHRNPCQARALVQRHAELRVGLQKLRIDIRKALRPVVLGLGRRVVGDRLIVDRRMKFTCAQCGSRMVQPVPQRLQPPCSQKLGFTLSCAK